MLKVKDGRTFLRTPFQHFPAFTEFETYVCYNVTDTVATGQFALPYLISPPLTFCMLHPTLVAEKLMKQRFFIVGILWRNRQIH